MSGIAEDDVMLMFLKDRQVNGDFISKATDVFWIKQVVKLDDVDSDAIFADTPQLPDKVNCTFYYLLNCCVTC